MLTDTNVGLKKISKRPTSQIISLSKTNFMKIVIQRALTTSSEICSKLGKISATCKPNGTVALQCFGSKRGRNDWLNEQQVILTKKAKMDKKFRRRFCEQNSSRYFSRNTSLKINKIGILFGPSHMFSLSRFQFKQQKQRLFDLRTVQYNKTVNSDLEGKFKICSLQERWVGISRCVNTDSNFASFWPFRIPVPKY